MKKLLTQRVLNEHDKVCTHLHYSICKALGIEMTDKWYAHTHQNQHLNLMMQQYYGTKGRTDRHTHTHTHTDTPCTTLS